jgi:copper resistance protein B
MRGVVFALPLLVLASPVMAQEVDHSAHGAPSAEPAAPEPDHSGMDHGAMDHPQMDHGAMDHSPMDHSQHAMPAALAPAMAPPPRASEGPRHAADAVWGEAAMAPAREVMALEGGRMQFGVVRLKRLEAALGDSEGYAWEAEALYGGDINRFVLTTEGEGEFGGSVHDADVEALWSHAIGPWFDMRAGVRLDLEPETRSHLALGVQGLAPWMIHVDAMAYLSDKGDVTATIEADHDMRITQSLILQPRVEFDLAAQDVPERGLGAGLSSVEAGLRLRYEITRQFAPYVGVQWEQALGKTRRMARAAGDDASEVAVLLGLRAWF